MKVSRSMNHLKGVDKKDLEQFKYSSQYTQLLSLVDGYHKKYLVQKEKENVDPEFKSKEHFEKLFEYVIKVLVKNVLMIEKDE